MKFKIFTLFLFTFMVIGPVYSKRAAPNPLDLIEVEDAALQDGIPDGQQEQQVEQVDQQIRPLPGVIATHPLFIKSDWQDRINKLQKLHEAHTKYFRAFHKEYLSLKRELEGRLGGPKGSILPYIRDRFEMKNSWKQLNKMFPQIYRKDHLALKNWANAVRGNHFKPDIPVLKPQPFPIPEILKPGSGVSGKLFNDLLAKMKKASGNGEALKGLIDRAESLVKRGLLKKEDLTALLKRKGEIEQEQRETAKKLVAEGFFQNFNKKPGKTEEKLMAEISEKTDPGELLSFLKSLKYVGEKYIGVGRPNEKEVIGWLREAASSKDPGSVMNERKIQDWARKIRASQNKRDEKYEKAVEERTETLFDNFEEKLQKTSSRIQNVNQQVVKVQTRLRDLSVPGANVKPNEIREVEATLKKLLVERVQVEKDYSTQKSTYAKVRSEIEQISDKLTAEETLEKINAIASSFQK